ncbi:MAG TPA: glycosyltransferase family 4 protein [Blastocatellia bacterium]|nr:glycosyltransferase family 4 protein [Blastocatellia bacterium]
MSARGAYLLVTGDFARTGGMDRANFALASHLAEEGNEVHLVAHRADPALEVRQNVHLHRVPKPAGSYLLGEPLLARAGRSWAHRLSPRACRVVVNGGNCLWGDANWVHYVHAAYEPTSMTGTLYRLKTRVARDRALRQERETLRRASVVVCNSERTRKDVIERLGVSASRTHVVYYGTDAEAFGPVTIEARLAARRALGLSSDRPLVLFIGALGDRRKGFDTLFAAWRSLSKERRWDADLIVAGVGSELSAWRARAVEEGLAERIRFLGFRSDVDRLLAASDALVHPARYEAYGLGVREALSRGVPALVSESAGVAEHYPSALGELLIRDPESPEELADRLRHWRRSLESTRDRVARLAQALREHTWERMSSEIVRVIEAND